jgi:hypothetical protein
MEWLLINAYSIRAEYDIALKQFSPATGLKFSVVSKAE